MAARTRRARISATQSARYGRMTAGEFIERISAAARIGFRGLEWVP
jgi:hypothetical protein